MSETPFNSEFRRAQLKSFQQEEKEFDLLVVGGGITGAGLARDAAQRGLSVLLVEAKDFAFGTSSRSSKLVHGGLRYLENFEFQLVFEALSERQRLYQMAPHLVHPLRFVFPVYDHSRVGMFKMACGMWLYDALSLFRGKSHEMLGRKRSLERTPILAKQGLRGSFVYSDAYMDDDRLVHETLRSAHQNGAVSLNHVAAEKVDFVGERVQGVTCRDQLTGETFSVKVRHLASTVGPWTDDFGTKVLSDWQEILSPSKGIHLTFSRARLSVKDAVVLSDDRHSRIVFVIPRHDMVIVGTTDTTYTGDPGEVVATKEDVEYLLQVCQEYFPQADLCKEDILGSYAGVRPLVKEDGASVGKTSREHTIISDPRGMTFVAGGKYTTYRKMAEEILDKILDDFPHERRRSLQSCATTEPLNELCSKENLLRATSSVTQWAEAYALPELWIEKLVARHGHETEEMLARWKKSGLPGGSASDEQGGRSEEAERQFWEIEALQAARTTMCLNLEDFYWRRCHLFLAEKDHGVKWLPTLAAAFARSLGWSEAETQKQIQNVRERIQFEKQGLG